MKTIIIKATEETNKTLYDVVHKLEKFTDKQIENAVICTRYCDDTNYSIVCAEMKEATKINDFDLFIVGVKFGYYDLDALKLANKVRTLTIDDDDYDSAKNYVLMR